MWDEMTTFSFYWYSSKPNPTYIFWVITVLMVFANSLLTLHSSPTDDLMQVYISKFTSDTLCRYRGNRCLLVSTYCHDICTRFRLRNLIHITSTGFLSIPLLKFSWTRWCYDSNFSICWQMYAIAPCDTANANAPEWPKREC